jgi:RNA polymerase sigma factor (sigma-70 family)
VHDLLRDFGAFYRDHEDRVLGYFLRRTRSAEIAADLTAETFARALEGRRRYNPHRGEVGAWLFGIARNVLYDSIERGRVDDRIRRRLGMEPLVLDEKDLAEVLNLNDVPIVAALDSLPPDQGKAVTGRIVEERSYAELATTLQCSQSVVRKRVSRGLAQLRSTLEDWS